MLVPPAAVPLSVTEAKAHLNYAQSEQDALDFGMVMEATAHVDGPEGILGRCLIAQTLELTADAFPYHCGCIRLPCPPLIGVTSVHHVDQDGAEQLVDQATYQVVGIGDQGRIELAYGQTWPSARAASPRQSNIVYEAGYGPDHNFVPESIRAGLKLMIGTFFAQRETLVEGGIFETTAAARLFAPFKVFQP